MTTGGAGCVDGPPNIVPECWVAIWNAFQAGDIEAARRAQSRASNVVESLISLFEGGRYVAICKHVLGRRLGIECGDPRLPALPLSGAQRAAVDRALDQLQLEPVPEEAGVL